MKFLYNFAFLAFIPSASTPFQPSGICGLQVQDSFLLLADLNKIVLDLLQPPLLPVRHGSHPLKKNTAKVSRMFRPLPDNMTPYNITRSGVGRPAQARKGKPATETACKSTCRQASARIFQLFFQKKLQNIWCDKKYAYLCSRFEDTSAENNAQRFLKYGQIPEWPNGADCKSAGLRLRWFESIFAHTCNSKPCGSSSVDRALAFQAGGRGFEPRLPLHFFAVIAQR